MLGQCSQQLDTRSSQINPLAIFSTKLQTEVTIFHINDGHWFVPTAAYYRLTSANEIPE